MRNFFLLLLVTHCLNVFAQDDSLDIKFAPTLTELGKPVGEKISQKIDKEGGKLVSSDGRMELIIPQDALSKKTTISIQPVINTLSPGDRSAYQLEPSGITFQKPLQIIFHFSSKENATMPEFRNIAWQDDKGQWYALDSSVVDTTARTVSGNISHFSTWMWFDAFVLKPTTARVKVGKKLNLYIWCAGVTSPSGRDLGVADQDIPPKIKFSTYVNGVRGGNAVVGTVTPVRDNGLQMLDYTAPSTVPDNNPVAVSVEATANFILDKKKYKKLKLVSNITIYDKSYEITVIGYNKQHVGRCTISGIDSSTCILQLNGDKTRLLDIQNMEYKITINSCPCNVRELHSGYDIGPIDIAGASKITVVPANPPQHPYPFVTIYFIKTIAVIPGMAVDPCGGNIGASVPAWPMPAAVPMLLAFEAKDEEYTVAKQGGDNGFEIKVKPVKEDQ